MQQAEREAREIKKSEGEKKPKVTRGRVSNAEANLPSDLLKIVSTNTDPDAYYKLLVQIYGQPPSTFSHLEWRQIDGRIWSVYATTKDIIRLSSEPHIQRIESASVR